jgi:hypothetical protein
LPFQFRDHFFCCAEVFNFMLTHLPILFLDAEVFKFYWWSHYQCLLPPVYSQLCPVLASKMHVLH